MQIHPLLKFVNQLTLNGQNLLLKTGLILTIVMCATFDVAVSRDAEEAAESPAQSETAATTDPAESRQPAATPDSDESETSEENQRLSEFGLSNRNPFDNGNTSQHFIWQRSDQRSAVNGQQEQATEDQQPDPLIQPYLDSLQRWRYPPHLTDLSKLYNWKPKPKRDEEGIALPMDSNLKITGLQSVTIEANKTHYFGEGDLNRYGGYGYGGGYGGYSSGT